MINTIHERTLGETLYLEIDKNEYLNKLYNKLLINYSKKLLEQPFDFPTTKELNDLLTFADILSMSTLPKKSGYHKVWSEQIISFLRYLIPNDSKIDFYSFRVLHNCTNYKALIEQKIDYKFTNFDELLFNLSKQDYLKIPHHKNEYFILEQKQIYDQLDKGNFSYSAPTSMGKSFIMRVFIRNKIESGSTDNFAILVPTKALINEFKRKILDELKGILNTSNYRVVSSAGDIVLEQDHHFIFVMTPERMLYLNNDKPSININYLFIDEAHKICSKDPRSSFYYQLVNNLSKRQIKPKIYFSSPNIPNPEIYKSLIPNKQLKERFTSFSPVHQISYLVDKDNSKLKLYNDHLKQFTDLPLPQDMTDLISLIKKVTKDDKQTLVYSNSKDKTIQNATEYANTLPYTNDTELIAIANDVERQIHKDYYLVELLKKGIAYHIGYLPASIKLRIERAFIEGKIKVIFCTSTLLEGVNLPADNLIITSYRNGTIKLTPVGFKNLIGRVGRLEYSMFGNVFLLTSEKDKLQKYEDFLVKDIEKQGLSIDKALTQEQKKQVLEFVTSEKNEIIKDEETTYEQHQMMVKMSLLLVDNIKNNNHDSLVVDTFVKENKNEVINTIKEKYKNEPNLDTLDLTFDQYHNIHDAIQQGLHYPPLCIYNGKDSIDFAKTGPFLHILFKIFKWDIYETETIANEKLLNYYGSILNQWMSGFGVNYIIQRSLEYKVKHPEEGIYSRHRKIAEYYDKNNSHHRNLVMAEVLDILDRTILFTFANYFRIFTSEYKKQHNISEDDKLDNDWYEYVEYGTTNSKVIELQRIGYSRESANFILNQKDKFMINRQNITTSFSLILENLQNCTDEGVKIETEDIYINVPEVFCT